MLLLLLPVPIAATELIFSQGADGQAIFGPSYREPGLLINAEVADDFDLTASIDRIVAYGYLDFGTPVTDFTGVWVRFYAFGLDGKPAAEQSATFIPADDPGLVNGLAVDGSLDITLPSAFSATGKHFVTVQPIVTADWRRWSANYNNPHGQPFYFRDLGTGMPVPDWQNSDGSGNLSYNSDVAFELYGTLTGAGHIDSLSASTLSRSGYLEIFGSTFGGSGQVSIDGLPAPVADWTGTRIVAYVPETAALGTVSVEVTNSTGQPSNVVNLDVTTRTADGRANWRFRMNGPYAQVRPVIGSDGTIYAIDVFQHLYAISPDGGLKWLVRGAGNKGVAVGSDDSIYVGSESEIRAFYPNGMDKWTYVQDPRAFILVGVSVGPDDNVYAVATEGMGVFSLTPAGGLRWQVPEPYRRLIVDYNEIVFGDNGGAQQLYFYANRNLRALTLDGVPVFSIEGGLAQLEPARSPAIAPDGSVHTDLTVYSPDGGSLWSFPTPYPYNVFTQPDVGSDGVHYFGQNLSQLFALNTDGSQRWHVSLNDYVAGPIVDPLNTQLVMGGDDTLDHPGLVLSVSAADGNELWRVVLPIEDPTVPNPATGGLGFNQYVDTRARFTADGLTAYLVTATATGDNDTSKSFVYSLDASPGISPPPPPPTPSIFTITPPSGTPDGGGAMTIGGSGYAVGATVVIGGAAAVASVLDDHTIDATAPALGPGTLNDVTVTNPDASFGTVPQAWFADFLDVPQADLFHPSVERIFRLGITAGCGSGLYCRDAAVTRAQMAVFLLKAEYGSSYAPPTCAGLFEDVACPSPFADWIEQLRSEGVTAGCSVTPLLYCPHDPVTRKQMAVFLLKAEHSSDYAPPLCASVFADVACPSLFADWIEQLAVEGVTAGCSASPLLYCPDSPVSRGQMAAFLVKTFNLQ